ncbi:hypothetical protein [Hymenobacter terricola]|uniref:hypothetical protein n=1 Tax=Hymenobacter terricola TaxID=2819236 RepID=UPI001B30F68E|nr:hypothetical protein [Hymenobacter terricola]
MLRLPLRALTGILLIWSLAVGCESKKAPVTTETPASAAASKLLTDTIAAAPVTTADTVTEVAQESPSGDVPALHIPFEERKTVAPGLVVIVKSIRPADTAIIREPSDLKLTFTIKRNNKVVYRDTANDGLMYDYYAMPSTKKLYPIWVSTGEGNGELLVAFNNRPSLELARRFYILNGQVAKIDTLPAFNGPAKDWDQDGKLEYNGIEDSGEVWADEQGHHRIAYNPALYYEIRPVGLVLDSALTERKARADYGVFQGFHYAGSPGVLFSKLPKNSRLRQP